MRLLIAAAGTLDSGHSQATLPKPGSSSRLRKSTLTNTKTSREATAPAVEVINAYGARSYKKGWDRLQPAGLIWHGETGNGRTSHYLPLVKPVTAVMSGPGVSWRA